MTLFERALVAHLVADWLLQNDWLARNKVNPAHPAAWLHAGIHGLLLSWALGWPAGLILAGIHLLVDTRRPLRWWQRVFRQTTEGEVGLMVAIWADQVAHILCLAALTGLF